MPRPLKNSDEGSTSGNDDEINKIARENGGDSATNNSNTTNIGTANFTFKQFNDAKPPKYSGAKGSTSLLQWLESIKCVLDYTSCPEKLKVKMAASSVHKGALNWWNAERKTSGREATELKCGGIVIGCMFDHRAADGYSANMFISSWADITLSKPPSMIPSFQRSILNPRCPTTYSSSIDNVFTLFEPPTKPAHDPNDNNGDHLLINRVYYIEGEQLSRVQVLASENGRKRSKLEAFTSFLWKIVALSMEDSEDYNQMCSVALAVDGRSRLSQGDGDEKEKLLASHFGNVLSIPSGSKRSKILKEMSLSEISTEVHEFLHIATGKDHFLDLIDWVEERRSQPLVAKAFASNEMSVLVSSGARFDTMDKVDFGWGKVAFGSCHVPSCRLDRYVMTLPSPTSNNDWVVYMRLPSKHMKYIETHASRMFKPLNADYLQI
ncbi:hypothetical protein R6Q59_006513 [Mikania micrantha]